MVDLRKYLRRRQEEDDEKERQHRAFIEAFKKVKHEDQQEREEPNIKKIKSPYELMREREKGQKEVQQYRRYVHRRTTAGRVGSGLEAFRRARINAYVYGGEVNRPLVGRRYVRRARRTLTPEAKAELMRRLNRGRTIQRPNFVPIGWESMGVVRQLQNEVSGNTGHDEVGAGSRTAKQISREVSLFGNLPSFSHTKQVEREALFNAHDVNINPAVMLEREVSAFANVLNPFYARPIKRKRRRR